MKYPLTLVWVVVILSLAHCSETPVTVSPTAPVAERQTTSEDSAPLPPELVKSAEQFQRFVNKELPEKEHKALLARCAEKPDENLFCFSYLNFEKLESDVKTKRKKGPPRAKRLRAKIAKGEITNWDDLRATPVNALLRGLSALSPREQRLVREKAEAETRCPNFVAPALAATLEDELPEGISPLELAGLYQKGGVCPMEPADQESLLCRAGLFYFLAQKYDEATQMLTLATKVDKAYTGRSLYWLYRSKTAQKDTSGAAAVLTQMRERYPFSFHTLVALSSNKLDPGEVLKRNLPAGSKRSQTTPEVNRLLDQLETLRKLEHREAAAKVLAWAVAESEESEPEVRVYIAQLKDDRLEYRAKISLLSDVLYKHPTLVAKETMELYFPKVYYPIFEKNASGLDPYFLLSVARQESAFNPRAVSSAKAKGLLQIQPKTGRRFWSQKRMDLGDPDTNVQIGSRYLQELLRKTNGQVHFALAAYNAGENRLAIWEMRYQTTEPVLFIDLIPFRETREYVASILRNYFWYRRIHAPIDSYKNVFDLNVTKNVE